MNLNIWTRSAVIAGTLLSGAIAPALAQYNGGNDAGSGKEAISVPRKQQIVYPPTIQAAVDRFSQSLSADRIGHAPTFEAINGGAIDPLANSLLPAGLAADGSTAKAARDLAYILQGMRSNSGKIDAAKLNAAVGAYNNYVKVLRVEVGAERAPVVAPAAQKAVKGLLSSLLQVANQASAQVPSPATPNGSNPKSASSATNN